VSGSLNPLPPWADEEAIQRVLATIRHYDGNPDVISSSELAAMLGVPDSPGQPGTRAVIAEILRRGLAPIGANFKGYFVLRTQVQLDAYVRELERRARAIQARAQNVARAWEIRNGGAAIKWVPEPEEDPDLYHGP
jgi:hypothetical protein